MNNYPDHVLFNINVAVVAMILRKRYGFEFERNDDEPGGVKSVPKSNEMWEMTEKLHDVLIECLGTDGAILNFINWFFNGVRKTFEGNNFVSQNTSSFSLQYQQQVLVFPDTCFQCKKPYSSTTSQDKWCHSCESYLFESKFHTWTSGNVELDRFIRQTQREALDSTSFLRWIPFSSFTDLNKIGKGGFSDVYSGKYTKDHFDGTFKQWVTNMEHQIILNYLQCRDDEKDFDDVPIEKWDGILLEFATKMKQIYHDRKVLKCKPRILSDENSETKVKRSNSFTKLKSLLKKRPSLKRNKKKLLSTSKSSEPTTRITQVPVTVSPIRNKFTPKTVVLKRLVDSQNLSSGFIREMKTHYLSLKKSSKIPLMYGLTQDPQTKDYYIVLQYANDFDLHGYLTRNFVNIDWWQRISILDGIVRGIYDLHKANLIHCNLHTGNILVRHGKRRKEIGKINNNNNNNNTPPSVKIWISDSGLLGPAGSSSSGGSNLMSGSSHLTSEAITTGGNNNNRNSIPSVSPVHSMVNVQKGIYGILPFIDPEVLKGKEYTQHSDIYSLGIIMWELSNSATLKKKQRHKPPFHDRNYDINLAADIVINETRPDIDEHAIPECWLDLMKKCWASKPEDRPNIEDIMKITGEWNMERRKSLNLGSRSSLVFSLNQSISSNNNNMNTIGENVIGEFLEAERKRVEGLSKGKQVEKSNRQEIKDENKENKDIIENVNQDDNNDDDNDDIHSENLMSSKLIDFIVETLSSSNNDEILENPSSLNKIEVRKVEKEKVDSGYQQPREDQDDVSLEQREEIKQTDDESNPEKNIEEKNLNKHEEKHDVNEIVEPILVQDDKTKHIKIDDNQIGVKQNNQDNPIKNGIEANSETGSKGK